MTPFISTLGRAWCFVTGIWIYGRLRSLLHCQGWQVSPDLFPLAHPTRSWHVVSPPPLTSPHLPSPSSPLLRVASLSGYPTLIIPLPHPGRAQVSFRTADRLTDCLSTSFVSGSLGRLACWPALSGDQPRLIYPSGVIQRKFLFRNE